MKDFKGTPGEWRYTSRNVDNDANWASRIPFAIEVENGSAVIPIADICDQPHAEENARLFAASKDILKALQKLYSNGHLIHYASDTKEDCEIKSEAISALRKALGDG